MIIGLPMILLLALMLVQSCPVSSAGRALDF